MNKVFTDNGWADYLYWQSTDRKTVKRINDLLKDIERNGHSGIGKPEPLRHELAGIWSRRIDSEHRLLYTIENDEIIVIQCRYHYE